MLCGKLRALHTQERNEVSWSIAAAYALYKYAKFILPVRVSLACFRVAHGPLGVDTS